MLMVAHDCNLNCAYCYETHKDSGRMDAGLAKELIEREFARVREDERFDELEVDFMGGEPLMNFELIREVVEWLESRRDAVPFICFATTNGTLLDEGRKNWFRRHRNAVWLGASVDGTEAMQRSNRGVAGEKIDLEFFRTTWPDQDFHMTVSRKTLPYLAQGVISLQGNGYRIASALAQGEDWSTEDARTYYGQLVQLAEHYLSEDGADLIPLNVLDRLVLLTESPSDGQCKYCGSGDHMVTYDIDGKPYPCHMFTPPVLGEAAVSCEEIDLTSDEAVRDPFCDTCALRGYCPTCVGFNYRYRGSPAARDRRMCAMTLAEAKAAGEFQLKAIADERLGFDAVTARHAKAALAARGMLAPFDLSNPRPPFARIDLQEE